MKGNTEKAYPTKGVLPSLPSPGSLRLLKASGKGLLHRRQLGTDPLGVVLNPLPLGVLPHVSQGSHPVTPGRTT
jgi:hypothetical protein